MRRIPMALFPLAFLSLAASAAAADVGAPPAPAAATVACGADGRAVVYRPLPQGGYQAMTVRCRPPRSAYLRLRAVSGATNMERLTSLTMQPPGARDNSMGRSTPP